MATSVPRQRVNLTGRYRARKYSKTPEKQLGPSAGGAECGAVFGVGDSLSVAGAMSDLYD
jgi:hypothetical protein